MRKNWWLEGKDGSYQENTQRTLAVAKQKKMVKVDNKHNTRKRTNRGVVTSRGRKETHYKRHGRQCKFVTDFEHADTQHIHDNKIVKSTNKKPYRDVTSAAILPKQAGERTLQQKK